MKKSKRQPNTARRRIAVPAFVLAAAIVVTLGVSISPVRADQFDEQIQTLQQQNASAQNSVTALEDQASSYQDAIDKLQSQIASLQFQINSNETKQANLQSQIVAAQRDLDHQKQLLGELLKTMYVSGQMSTVEMLATSKDLSTFVDAETYRTAVQTKIQNTLVEITDLQNRLNDQKQQVQVLLATQKGQQNDLASKQSEQDNLLAMNESQQTTYNQKIQANQTQIAKLRQEQIAANMAGSSGVFYGGACDSSHGDTYPHPWCSDTQDSDVDQWGMYNRECTSYAAWMEYSTGHSVPYGLGNAGDWPSNVPRSWIVKTPHAGDVAVRPANPNLYFGSEQDVGHVMYIETVNGDGTIAISQYNASLNGTYSYVAQKSTAGLIFIHFPSR